VAAAACGGCLGLSAAAQHARLYLVPRKSIWSGHAAHSAAPETKAWLLQTMP